MTVDQLSELFDYKNRLMKDLLSNENIVNLIRDDADMIYEDPSKLAYTHIFPYEYVPETDGNGSTYICFDVEIEESYSKTFLSPVLDIWVFSHKSKLRLPEGGLRVDTICSEIAKTINGSRYYGMGELLLSSVKRFAPVTDYQGKYMSFDTTDYNKLNPSGKRVPSNRKVY